MHVSSHISLAQARELFPVCHRRVYLDNAAVSPLPTPARKAMERQLLEMNELGPAVNLDDWIAPLDRVRAILARLVNAAPGEIAFVKNTSEGLSFVARGLSWKPGDRIVGFDCEFPANVYPWLALRPLGVQVDLLPGAALADPDRIRQACRGAFNGKAPSRLKCRDTPAGKNLQRFGAERSVRLCAANRHPGSKDPAHRRAEEGRILQRLCFHGCEDPCKDRTFRWMFNEDPGGTFLHSWT